MPIWPVERIRTKWIKSSSIGLREAEFFFNSYCIQFDTVLWCGAPLINVLCSKVKQYRFQQNTMEKVPVERIGCASWMEIFLYTYIPFTLNGAVHGEDATHRPSPLISYECYLCEWFEVEQFTRATFSRFFYQFSSNEKIKLKLLRVKICLQFWCKILMKKSIIFRFAEW